MPAAQGAPRVWAEVWLSGESASTEARYPFVAGGAADGKRAVRIRAQYGPGGAVKENPRVHSQVCAGDVHGRIALVVRAPLHRHDGGRTGWHYRECGGQNVEISVPGYGQRGGCRGLYRDTGVHEHVQIRRFARKRRQAIRSNLRRSSDDADVHSRRKIQIAVLSRSAVCVESQGVGCSRPAGRALNLYLRIADLPVQDHVVYGGSAARLHGKVDSVGDVGRVHGHLAGLGPVRGRAVELSRESDVGQV